MGLPRFYKKIKQGLVVVSILSLVLYAINNYYISTQITQTILETHALQQHRISSFNPRHTTHELFSYLNNQPSLIANGTIEGINFHWDDWVDLSAANKMLNKYRKKFPDGQCDDKIRKYADVNGYYMESHDKKVYRGMADVYCLKEIPSKIIATTDDKYVEIPVVHKKRVGLNNGTYDTPVTKETLIKQSKAFDKSPNDKFNTLNFRHLQKQIDVRSEDFVFNPAAEIFKLQDKLNQGNITEEEIDYLKFLRYSDSIVDSADRFFKYPWITTDVINGRSHHLAYPFFKRFIGDRERQSVIHHMVRAWFKFAEANEFASWVNYGSLLGWAYNGVNMPWDTDIDIQLPIAQLDRLGRKFNRSLILENPRFGNAKYFLEISPTYIRQGNGRNFIDARFIDINSGLYIDISALSHSGSQPPKEAYDSEDEFSSMMVHCKNWNWHSLEELLPIRHTWFEGASIYIPHNVSRILTRKYGKASFTTKSHFANHNYQKDISMWVPDTICPEPPSQDETRFASEEHMQLTFNGACENKILQDEYRIIHECAQRHHKVNYDVDHSIDYTIEDWGDLPLFRKDSWDYYNDINQHIVSTEDWYINDDTL